jgi:hypothetical protein
MIEWEEGAIYRISPVNKKQIVMKKIYYKSDDYDQKIISHEAYRSGWVEVEGDEMSYYLDDAYDPKVGTDVWIFPMTDHWIVDGVVGDFSFSDNISKEDQEKLEPLIYENGVEVIEAMGWEFEDTETWFFGELEIIKK